MKTEIENIIYNYTDELKIGGQSEREMPHILIRIINKPYPNLQKRFGSFFKKGRPFSAKKVDSFGGKGRRFSDNR